MHIINSPMILSEALHAKANRVVFE